MGTKVWIVRGGGEGQFTGQFLELGYVGIGYKLHDVDLSCVNDPSELGSLYREKISGADQGAKSHNLTRVGRFLFEIQIDDYVVTPSPHRERLIFGRIASRPYHDPNDEVSNNYLNRRKVTWHYRSIRRDELFTLDGQYVGGVAEVTDPEHLRTFFKITGRDDLIANLND